ncbi:MAG: hypothetical protein WDO16_16955 [Bacteroidota bacterium]
MNDNNSFITQSVIQRSLGNLKTYIESKKKIAADSTYSGHLFTRTGKNEEPENAKPTAHAVIPPGAPIGCED